LNGVVHELVLHVEHTSGEQCMVKSCMAKLNLKRFIATYCSHLVEGSKCITLYKAIDNILTLAD